MRVIIYLIIIFLLYSCDNRKDFYESLNQEPKIFIKSDKNLGSINSKYQNNIVDSFKVSNNYYYLDYKFYDDNINYKINFLGDGFENIKDVTNITNEEKQKIEFGTAVFKIENQGKYNLVVKAIDAYNKEVIATSIVTAFNNLLPITNISVFKDSIYSQYEYVIDASASYDKDEKYGGKIIKYRYKVGLTYDIITQFNKIRYIFPGPGTYTIRVTAIDNDNEAGNEVSYQLNIP